MAFVYEKVTKPDKAFWESMKFKNFNEVSTLNWNSSRYWCADSQRNAFLVCIGKAGVETPIAYDLWCNNNRIRIYINSSAGWYTPADVLDGSIIFSKDTLEPKKRLIELVEEALLADRGSFSNSVRCYGGINWKFKKE